MQSQLLGRRWTHCFFQEHRTHDMIWRSAEACTAGLTLHTHTHTHTHTTHTNTTQPFPPPLAMDIHTAYTCTHIHCTPNTHATNTHNTHTHRNTEALCTQRMWDGKEMKGSRNTGTQSLRQQLTLYCYHWEYRTELFTSLRVYSYSMNTDHHTPHTAHTHTHTHYAGFPLITG